MPRNYLKTVFKELLKSIKMKKIIFILSLIIWLGMVPLVSNSQTEGKKPKELYAENIQNSLEVFNGGEYIEFPSYFEGHSFFQTKAFLYADIVYNGLIYSETPLLYDLVSHKLVTFNPIHAAKVSIQTNRVSQFTFYSDLGNFSFVRGDLISKDAAYSEKFLEEIIDGDVSLYCLHEKRIKKRVEDLDRTMTFEKSENYLIKHNNELFPLKGKNSIFKILPIDKKQAKESLKLKGIKYKVDPKIYFSDVVLTFNKTQL